jgi:hypothetical protein
MSDILVEFNNNVGARIHRDPAIIQLKKHQDNVLLNPDIEHLKGISPSFWKKEGNNIVPMTHSEVNETHLFLNKGVNVKEVFLNKESIINEDDLKNIRYLIGNINYYNKLKDQFAISFQQVTDETKKKHDILTTILYRWIYSLLFLNICTIAYLIYQGIK